MLRTKRLAPVTICAATAALAICGPAAATITCGGKVGYLGINPEGFVSVSVGPFGVWHICNQTTTFANNGQTFTPEGCRAWYATLLASQKAGQSVRIYFSSSVTSDDGPECTAFGSWVYPSIAPYHLSVLAQ